MSGVVSQDIRSRAIERNSYRPRLAALTLPGRIANMGSNDELGLRVDLVAEAVRAFGDSWG
jgi:hypothetical protein